jgi:hypothetical protein
MLSAPTGARGAPTRALKRLLHSDLGRRTTGRYSTGGLLKPLTTTQAGGDVLPSHGKRTGGRLPTDGSRTLWKKTPRATAPELL